MEENFQILGEIFKNPLVSEQLQNAPESWISSLLNSVILAIPYQHVKLVPSTFLTILTALFAIFDPTTLNDFKTAEFYATPKTQLRSEYDYVIVGGGSAGCLLANRLSASHSVLLIEAGTTTNLFSRVPRLNFMNFGEPAFGLDWFYKSTEQKYAFKGTREKRAHMGAGKGLGGSSHLNFQFYSRAWDEDYDRWERIFGAKGWNAKEMVHFMKKHEKAYGDPLDHLDDRHGKDGELSVAVVPLEGRRKVIADAIIAAGSKVTSTSAQEDHNNGRTPGFSHVQTTVEDSGAISHSARAFIDPIRVERKDRLHILLDTMVEKVILDENNRATGVEFISSYSSDEISRQQIKAKKEVILSAGAARDPQIMMLSGIGPKEELEKHHIPVRVNLPGVGANLHDHSIVLGSNMLFPQKSEESGRGWHDLELKELHKFLVNKTGSFKSPVGHLALAFINSPVSEDKTRPDLEFVALDGSLGDPLGFSSVLKYGVHPKDLPEFVKGCPDSLILSPVLMRSKSRGKVHLKSTSIIDHPELDMQYLSDPGDVKVLVEGMKILRKIEEAMSSFGGTARSIQVPGCDQEIGSDEYYECNVRALTVSVWHMAGTCRLGRKDDPMTVVDNELRVIGVPNLRVIDASVIPEETTGHMVATVYGIAEKGAHLILESDRSGKEEL